MSRDVVLMLIGAGLGSLVTLGVAWFASRGARRMLREIGLLLRGLEEAGLVRFSRNERGHAVGLVIQLSGKIGMSGSASDSVSGEKTTPSDDE